jgi:hypothetical protein
MRLAIHELQDIRWCLSNPSLIPPHNLAITNCLQAVRNTWSAEAIHVVEPLEQIEVRVGCATLCHDLAVQSRVRINTDDNNR